jgi:prepilin-type N-terminal cleavage/methylation domain-containing protein
MKTKKVKGFTLVELIVVVAIFSIIMGAALQLLIPVGEQFTSTAEYEGARAAIDNTNRYVTGTLRYADRVWVYYGKDYTNADQSIDDSTISSCVSDFSTTYFKNNYKIEATDINVLAFDNKNQEVKLYTYSNTAGSDVFNYVSTTNPLNEALDTDYSFKYYLGEYDYIDLNDGKGYTINPLSNTIANTSKVSVTIDVFKKYSNGTTKALEQCSVVSFAPVNAQKTESVIRYRLDGSGAKETDASDGAYLCDSINGIDRFRSFYNEVSGNTPEVDDSFFIVYTLPKKY